MNTKRRYDRAFKKGAVKLRYERSSITALASELGILPDRIYRWRKYFKDYDTHENLVATQQSGCKIQYWETYIASSRRHNLGKNALDSAITS